LSDEARITPLGRQRSVRTSQRVISTAPWCACASPLRANGLARRILGPGRPGMSSIPRCRPRSLTSPVSHRWRVPPQGLAARWRQRRWITSGRTSPMLATWLCLSSALTNACRAMPACPLEGEPTAPVPVGASFLPSSYARRGGHARLIVTDTTSGCPPGTRRPSAHLYMRAKRSAPRSSPCRPGVV